MSRDLGRDVPDLEIFIQENFGLIFRSLDKAARSDFPYLPSRVAAGKIAKIQIFSLSPQEKEVCGKFAARTRTKHK